MINFLSISLNMCFGCSKEPSHGDSSFEYPKLVWLRYKEKKRTLILGPAFSLSVFSKKVSRITRAGTHKILVRKSNREETDQVCRVCLGLCGRQLLNNLTYCVLYLAGTVH